MIKLLLLLPMCVALLTACNSEEKLSEQSVVDRNQPLVQQTQLDHWIEQHYTLPYGVNVAYRWNRNTGVNSGRMYPPKEDNIKAVLETIKALWIDLYEDERLHKTNFMRGKCPINIYLYGGRNIQANGTEMLYAEELSTAEMCLFDVNDFDPKDEHRVRELMRVVHHQFAKRLADLEGYDRDKFATRSKQRYSLSNVSLFRDRNIYDVHVNFANQSGFLTLPSMLSADDDFAEIVSAVLTSTPQDIARSLQIAAIPLAEGMPTGAEALASKISFVEEYFRKNWHMELRQLQQLYQQRAKLFFRNQSNL